MEHAVHVNAADWRLQSKNRDRAVCRSEICSYASSSAAMLKYTGDSSAPSLSPIMVQVPALSSGVYLEERVC